MKSVCDNFSKKGCFVMISNLDLEFIREFYKSYNFEVIEIKRFINLSVGKRIGYKEVIIINYWKEGVIVLSGGRGIWMGRIYEKFIK